jgi:hypothetical protein
MCKTLGGKEKGSENALNHLLQFLHPLHFSAVQRITAERGEFPVDYRLYSKISQV